MTKNWKCFISTSTWVLKTKLGKIWPWLKGSYLSIEIPLIMLSHSVTWQNKMSYLDFHKTYKHQIWQNDDSLWGTPTWQHVSWQIFKVQTLHSGHFSWGSPTHKVILPLMTCHLKSRDKFESFYLVICKSNY